MANVVEIVVQGTDRSGPAMTSAINNASRLGKEVKQLGGAVNAASNVLTVFGNTALESVGQQALSVGSALGGLTQAMKGMGGVRMAQWGVIGAVLGAATYSVTQYIEKLDKQAEATDKAVKMQDDLELALSAYSSEARKAELIEQRRFRTASEMIEVLREQGAEVQMLETLNQKLADSFEAAGLDKVINLYEGQAEELSRIIMEANAPEVFALQESDRAFEEHFQKIDELRERDVISAEEWGTRIEMIEQARLARYYNIVEQQEEKVRVMQERSTFEKKQQINIWLEHGSKAFQNLAAAAKASGKKGFEAAKAFSTASAIIDTYVAANGAYAALAKIPYVGPALGAAAAAAAIAAGMANVHAIQSQKPQAHSGLDYVPQDATYVLKAGEMVLDPGTSEAVRQAAINGGGGATHIVVNLDGRELFRAMGQASRDGRLNISAKAVA